MKERLKVIEKYLEFFPNDHIAKNNLLICRYSQELNLELKGSYYPRINYGFCEINSQIKAGKKYQLTNSMTNYIQNGEDTIVIWSESCGRLAFVDREYWGDVSVEWQEFMNVFKSYNPLDFDDLNNAFIYDIHNGRKLINNYDSIVNEFKQKLSVKINDIKMIKKREDLERLKMELGE